MQQPAQQWPQCDISIQNWVEQTVHLIRRELGENLAGAYLHGSLAQGAFFPPKSNVDLLAVTAAPLTQPQAAGLRLTLAQQAAERPCAGDISLRVITRDTAATARHPMQCEASYEAGQRPSILQGSFTESAHPAGELAVHLAALHQYGIGLYGPPVAQTMGRPARAAYLLALLEGLAPILEQEALLRTPHAGVLNNCRTLRMKKEDDTCLFTKEEGGEWALKKLPGRFRPLILNALLAHRSAHPVAEDQRDSAGLLWDNDDLLKFAGYARRRFRGWQKRLEKEYYSKI